MVYWSRRVGLLLVLAAVGVGVYGAVSVPGWPWSFPVACALAFVGSVGLTSPRPSSRLLAQYERWRALHNARVNGTRWSPPIFDEFDDFDWPERRGG